MGGVDERLGPDRTRRSNSTIVVGIIGIKADKRSMALRFPVCVKHSSVRQENIPEGRAEAQQPLLF